MQELPFQVELDWSGSGREGSGRIVTDDLELELSTPASMGGRGVGTNPEELLVSAVAGAGDDLGQVDRLVQGPAAPLRAHAATAFAGATATQPTW